MKKELTPTTTKGELFENEKHTQGEWRVSESQYLNSAWITSDNGDICRMDETGNHKANAEFIVKAVNERQKLLDSNKELLQALQDALDCPDMIAPGRFAYQISEKYAIANDLKRPYNFYQRLQTAINNAKNIQP